MSRRSLPLVLAVAASLFLSPQLHAQPVAKPRPTIRPTNLTPEDVPLFKFRFRVVQNDGKAPKGKFNFTLGFLRKAVNTTDDQWSPWADFTAEDAKMATDKHAYPNTYMQGWPLVLKAVVSNLGPTATIEGETQFVGFDKTYSLKGNLQGNTLGILIYPDKEMKLGFATMAQYNRDQFWSLLKDLPPNQGNQPKEIIIADRFIPGDSDADALKEGIENLSKIGFNTLADPSIKQHASLMKQYGIPYTAGGVYSPPGYTFEFTETPKDPSLDDWAQSQAKPFKDLGPDGAQIKLYAMADEPGWYYPAAFESLKKNPEGLKRFRDFLLGQKLTLQDLDAKSWDEVFPIGQSQATTLAKRKLFYWTMRFFPWDSSRYFADANRAMEKAFYPGIRTFNNWNFFSGRSYVPGAVANNGDKNSPDAGMGGQDWFEYARLKGTNVLWVEDWFGDNRSYQWSYYMARLDAAAVPNGLTTGGYIVPRTAGDMPNGILQKIVGVAGYGAKSIKYFVFGPEYNFPSNCYSFKSFLLPTMAKAHGMVAKAEPLLSPGKRPAITTALLFPRSAQMWDVKGDAPKPILTFKGMRHPVSDATNTNLDRLTVDYLAELNGLYVALQHSNIPATFIDEEELTPDRLKNLSVLYITTPNLPAESIPALFDWVKQGGTLILTSGAAARDRYDDPLPAFDETFKLSAKRDHGQPLLINFLHDMKVLGTQNAAAPVLGRSIASEKPSAPLSLAAQKPLTDQVEIGRGNIVYFNWFPGLTYLRSGKNWDKKDQFPSDFSKNTRDTIAKPLNAMRPDRAWANLDQPLVETPLLVSDKGTVMTLLNWNNKPIEKLRVEVKLGFTPSKVESVTHGALQTNSTSDGKTIFELPLDAADYVLFYK